MTIHAPDYASELRCEAARAISSLLDAARNLEAAMGRSDNHLALSAKLFLPLGLDRAEMAIASIKRAQRYVAKLPEVDFPA